MNEVAVSGILPLRQVTLTFRYVRIVDLIVNERSKIGFLSHIHTHAHYTFSKFGLIRHRKARYVEKT